MQRDEQVGAVVDRDLRRAVEHVGDVAGEGVEVLAVAGEDRDAVRSASVAATSSWVASGLAAHRATSAPPAVSVRHQVGRLRRDVQARRDGEALQRPLAPKRSRIERRTGIWASAQAIRVLPASASAGSAISLIGGP